MFNRARELLCKVFKQQSAEEEKAVVAELLRLSLSAIEEHMHSPPAFQLQPSSKDDYVSFVERIALRDEALEPLLRNLEGKTLKFVFRRQLSDAASPAATSSIFSLPKIGSHVEMHTYLLLALCASGTPNSANVRSMLTWLLFALCNTFFRHGASNAETALLVLFVANTDPLRPCKDKIVRFCVEVAKQALPPFMHAKKHVQPLLASHPALNLEKELPMEIRLSLELMRRHQQQNASVAPPGPTSVLAFWEGSALRQNVVLLAGCLGSVSAYRKVYAEEFFWSLLESSEPGSRLRGTLICVIGTVLCESLTEKNAEQARERTQV